MAEYYDIAEELILGAVFYDRPFEQVPFDGEEEEEVAVVQEQLLVEDPEEFDFSIKLQLKIPSVSDLALVRPFYQDFQFDRLHDDYTKREKDTELRAELMSNSGAGGSGDSGHDGSGDSGRSTAPDSSTGQVPPQWGRMFELMKTRKVDTALWAVRLMTILLCSMYLLPFGYHTSLYYKALMANAATSALRLHQRVPQVALTRLFFAQLLLEDSCHYLFYSIIFIYCQPVTLVMLPILLFAVLHFASYSLTLLDVLGRNTAWIGRILISIVEFQTVTILRIIAGSEIVIMIFTIMYTFFGRASFLTPFIYYRFLTLRYASRRNHYSRVMFNEFRMSMETVANHAKCPGFVGGAIRKVINLVSRFAPDVGAGAN